MHNSHNSIYYSFHYTTRSRDVCNDYFVAIAIANQPSFESWGLHEDTDQCRRRCTWSDCKQRRRRSPIPPLSCPRRGRRRTGWRARRETCRGSTPVTVWSRRSVRHRRLRILMKNIMSSTVVTFFNSNQSYFDLNEYKQKHVINGIISPDKTGLFSIISQTCDERTYVIF